MTKQRVLLVGADGHDLLNRISTLDLNRIPLGETSRGLILNPQGKIRASFWITPRGEHRFEIDFESPFLEILDQFTFAEKYELIPLPSSDSPAPPADSIDRILALEPRLGFEFFHDESTNPLEVNLKSAVHDQKGCYPGQEVIEKILALGSPAKKLVLLETKVKPEAPLGPLPQPLLDPETQQQVGTLTSISDLKTAESFGLGILKRTHLSVGLLVLSPNGTVFQVKKVSE